MITFVLPDKERNYQSYMVYVLTIIWSVVSGVIVSVGFIYFPLLWLRWLTFIFVSLFIAVFNLSLNQFGYTRTASWSLIIMLWLYSTIPCYSAGGVFAPGILVQMSVILTAGFLLGWRGGVAVGLLTMGTDYGLAYLEVIGQLPEPSVIHDPITRWIAAIIPFCTIIALQYYATNHLRTGLIALTREIRQREEAEKIKSETLYNLKERIKELKTLYAVSHILQDEEAPFKKLFLKIVDILPQGWQYPAIAAARVCIGQAEFSTHNFSPSKYQQRAERKTFNGTKVFVEVVYTQWMQGFDREPFLKEEDNLINMLAEMIKVYLERRDRKTELKDYKYALDTASIVSISKVDGTFSFINKNFCKASSYSYEELLGQPHSFIWSDKHAPEYFNELRIAMKDGKPYRGEFCNKAKDGKLYWVDAAIIPFLDEEGTIYQYLSINQDITERKEAQEKIKQNEALLEKITSQVPANTYMFEIEETGRTHTIFFNRGTDETNHLLDLLDPDSASQKLLKSLHEDDKALWIEEMKKAYHCQSAISFQYRIWLNGQLRWRWFRAISEKTKEGKILWYGASQDITAMVEYIASIEQMIFDISHIIRRPIATMKGLTRLILDSGLSEKEIKEISQKLYLISEEMDKFIHELAHVYNQKSQNTTLSINTSSLIDKRSSLFK